MNARRGALLARLFGRLRDERGIAIVTAMILSMTVVTLGATSVTLAVHNSEASSYDRRSVQSIHAAEAGLNYYFSHLQSGGVDSLECSIGQSLTTAPSAVRFDATATFYDSQGFPMSCPLRGRQPDSVLIRSLGRISNAPPTRTMEALVKLVPVPGGSFGEFAIFSDSTPQFNANIQVHGGESVEGNVYSNGNVLVSSNSTVYGDVEAQGGVTLASGASVKRDILAGGPVQLNSNATVYEDVISATSSVNLNSNSHVFHNVQAGTTITSAGGTIDGTVLPNTPSPMPPARTFPDLEFDPFAWQEAGYTVTTFATCLEAKAFIGAIPSGDHVVRILTPCDLSYSSGELVTLRGNLAIVSDGSLTMNSNTGFVNSGGEHNLFLLFGLGEAVPCNITFRSNTGIGDGIKAVFYTPCVVDMRSNAIVIEGQIFGGSVVFNSNVSLTYEPIGVPGYGVVMFEEDILYIREVAG